MRVFVFNSGNAFIGKFDVDRLDAIAAEVKQFARPDQLSSYDYLECDGRTWTLVPGSSGLELQEGRAHPPKQQSAGSLAELVDIERRAGRSGFQAKYTTDEIREIAKYQKYLIWLIYINPLTCGISGIVASFFIYNIAVSLRLKNPWLYPVSIVVPPLVLIGSRWAHQIMDGMLFLSSSLVSVGVLWWLNRRAVAALKTQGIRVDFFGADQQAIEKLPKQGP